MPLRITNVRNFLSAGLARMGYNPVPVFGNGADPDSIDIAPDQLVLLSFGAGGGPSNELVIENIGLYVRTAGLQSNYDNAEQLAWDVDKLLCLVDHSQYVDGIWVTSIRRSGSQPTLLMKDDGDRYHFTCTYIIGAEAGLDD